MIKKTLRYKNLDGAFVEEEWFFSMTHIELAEFESSVPGGMRDYMTNAMKVGDNTKTMLAYKELISRTVGRRGADGTHIDKSPEISNMFVRSNAFEALFVEILNDPKAMTEFMTGIMPESMKGKVAQAMATKDDFDQSAHQGLGLGTEAEMTDEQLLASIQAADEPKKITDYTAEELFGMTKSEFGMLFGNGKNLPRWVLVIAAQRKTKGI